MLEVSSLTRCYGPLVAVNEVSFTLQPGTVVGLLGHNGAGKTTIMKMLSGYLEPHWGSVRMDGQVLQHNPELIKSQLGYLPENLPVYPELTVAEYLDYAAGLKGFIGATGSGSVRRAVVATDLGDKLDARISTLSRGYKQRVGVAQAVLGNPRLLILDEPTNGLDPAQTQHIRTLIRELSRTATVLLSTHILQEVNALCDRVLMIHQGELALDSTLSDLQASSAVLLRSSLSLSQARPILAGLAGVVSVGDALDMPHAGDAGTTLRLQLAPGSNHQATSHAVAQSVISAGGELYQLTPEVRGLDALFHEVTVGSQEGFDHAA